MMDKVVLSREIHFFRLIGVYSGKNGREVETSIDNSTIAPKRKEKWVVGGRGSVVKRFI